MPGWDDIKWNTHAPSLGYAGPPVNGYYSTLAIVQFDGGRYYSIWDYRNYRRSSRAQYEMVDLFTAACVVTGILNGLPTPGGNHDP